MPDPTTLDPIVDLLMKGGGGTLGGVAIVLVAQRVWARLGNGPANGTRKVTCPWGEEIARSNEGVIDKMDEMVKGQEKMVAAIGRMDTRLELWMEMQRGR